MSTAGTVVFYNGVTMTNVLTRRFSEEAVRDDSDTDIEYHRFTVRVMGLVHAVQGTIANPVPAGTTPNVATSATLNQVTIRRMLLEDRKKFQMTVDGDTLLQANGTDTFSGSVQNPFYDVNNGPKPRLVEVSQIVGSNVYRVEFEIEIALIDCNNNDNTQGVLNNRWSMSDVIDGDWYTTRTMRGRLRLANSNMNPHSFRAWCIPPLQPNFKREIIDVVSSPDQLLLEYTVVDRQVFAAAPFPATTWSGAHIVSTNDGVTTIKELQVTVTGPPKVAKGDLIDLCATICTSKLKLTQVANALQAASIIDHLEANTVEMRVELLGDPGESPYALVPVSTDEFGKPLNTTDFPGYDPTKSQPTPLYGQCSPAGLLLAILQTPCNDDHRVPNNTNLNSQGNNSGNPTGAAVSVSTKDLSTSTEVEEDYSSSDSEAIYTHYRISSTYGSPQGVVQLPLTASSPGSTDTCAFIQICLATCWRVVRIEAERIGSAPEFPPPLPAQISDINIIVLDYKITPEAPELTADGIQKRYRATAEYTYGLSRPPTTSEGLLVGTLPWMASSIAADMFPASAYTTGILT